MKLNSKKILSILLILVLVLSFAACGIVEEITEEQDSPSLVVENFLTALKAKDFDKAQEYYSGDMGKLTDLKDEADDSEVSEFVDGLVDKALEFDYTLDNEVIAEDGQTATVDVVFATFNLSDTLSSVMSELITNAAILAQTATDEESLEDQINDLIKEYYDKAIEAADKDLEIKVTVKLTLVDGKWMIDDLAQSNDFLNAITGGLTDFAETFGNYFG